MSPALQSPGAWIEACHRAGRRQHPEEAWGPAARTCFPRQLAAHRSVHGALGTSWEHALHSVGPCTSAKGTPLFPLGGWDASRGGSSCTAPAQILSRASPSPNESISAAGTGGGSQEKQAVAQNRPGSFLKTAFPRTRNGARRKLPGDCAAQLGTRHFSSEGP